MSTLITASIDLTKIEKNRIVNHENGAKYLNIVLIPVADNKYGNDFMVVHSATKEERDNKVRGSILGNAKIAGKPRPATEPAKKPQNEKADDLPF